MSDTQNTQLDETPVTQEEVTPDNSEAGNTETPSHAQNAHRGDRRGGRDGARPPRWDKRGPRRDGMREEEKEFQEEMLAVDRVTRVTAWGRQIRFRASVVIGDGKGRIGLGTGKAWEVQSAVEKAIRDAKKNLITFPIVNGTIPHDVSVNFKSSSLYIHPAHPGTGIIAWGAVRKIFAVSWIKDVIAKQHGAPNMITNARVALKALKSLKPSHMNIAFGKKDEWVWALVQAEVTPVKNEAPVKKTVTKKPAAKKKAE